MSLAKKILGNTFIQFFGRIITALLAVISVKLITYYLGVEGYGQYTTVYEFVGLFAIIGDLGLYTIAIREMAEKEDEIQKIYSNTLTMRVIFTTIIMLLVGIGGMFIPQYQGTLIPSGIWICTLVVWLNLFFSIITSILQYHLKMHKATIALILGKIMGLVGVAYAVFFLKDKTLGFYTVIGSGILAHGVMALIALRYAKKYVDIKYVIDWDYWKYLIKKAWPYGLALVLSTIYFKVDVTLLSLLRDQKEVGFYGVPLRMVEVLVVLPLFFMNSVLGPMTKAIRESKEKLQKIFTLSLQFLLTIAVPIFLLIIFFSSDLIRIISSSDFLANGGEYGSDSVLILLTIALIISFFSTLCSFTLVAFNQQKKVLAVNSVGAFFNIFTNLYFIPIYGFMGAALTSIASQVIILFASIYLLQKTHKFHYDFNMILKTIFSGICVYFSLYYFIPLVSNYNSLMQIIFSAIVGGIIYFISLFSLNVFNIKMIKELITPIEK